MKLVEYWRWRYRNPATGRHCRTMYPMTAQEAADLYPDPQRIEGSMVLREVEDDAVDTTPDVFRPLPDAPGSKSRSPEQPSARADEARNAKAARKPADTGRAAPNPTPSRF